MFYHVVRGWDLFRGKRAALLHDVDSLRHLTVTAEYLWDTLRGSRVHVYPCKLTYLARLTTSVLYVLNLLCSASFTFTIYTLVWGCGWGGLSLVNSQQTENYHVLLVYKQYWKVLLLLL